MLPWLIRPQIDAFENDHLYDMSSARVRLFSVFGSPTDPRKRACCPVRPPGSALGRKHWEGIYPKALYYRQHRNGRSIGINPKVVPPSDA